MMGKNAFATPNFPPTIQQTLMLSSPPHCALCHDDGDLGGKGTANTPFARNMRARGLVEFDVQSLKGALDQMAADHVDSSGDCLDDIDELKAGRDPNVPDPPDACADVMTAASPRTTTAPPQTPSYGCVGKIAPTTDDRVSVAFLATLLGLLGHRRRFDFVARPTSGPS